MIATLEGQVSEKRIDYVVLDVSSIGYEIYVTGEDYNKLASGEPAKLYIYEYIREQSHELFGFLARTTQELFEKLMEVNGVGPKMALSLLSIGSDQALKEAIAGGDSAFIQQASGVGKRLAERLIVELKDKVGLIGTDLESTGLLQSTEAANRDEAVEALVSLGYSTSDAIRALSSVDAALPTGERIKLALKEASK